MAWLSVRSAGAEVWNWKVVIDVEHGWWWNDDGAAAAAAAVRERKWKCVRDSDAGRAMRLRRENMTIVRERCARRQPAKTEVQYAPACRNLPDLLHDATRTRFARDVCLYSLLFPSCFYSIPSYCIIMPRNSRRRRIVDDTMSDHIEEDATTQRRDVDAVDAVDEDEDEDRQTRPARSRGGASSSSKKASAAAAESERDDNEEEEDATPAFDADALGNKPMSRHDGQKLQGMASDWNMIESHLKESAFSLLTEVSTAVAEYADDNTARKVSTLRRPPSWLAGVPPPVLVSDNSTGTRKVGRAHERDH